MSRYLRNKSVSLITVLQQAKSAYRICYTLARDAWVHSKNNHDYVGKEVKTVAAFWAQSIRDRRALTRCKSNICLLICT